MAGTWANVDQVIAGTHERFVVFDHHDRIALLLQISERSNQPIIVARMQPNRRLIQQVQNADEPRADSGGQPHALPFAAAQRVGRSVQRQILRADAIKKREPPYNFSHNRLRHRPLIFCERKSAKEFDRRRN